MAQPTRPTQLRCNCLADPLGMDDAAPRLSWRLDAGRRRGARQSAYRILVSSRRRGAPDIWDSGRVRSDATAQIPFRGRPLTARERAWWRVRVWDERNRRSESPAAFWETGLPGRAHWLGSWIGAPFRGGLDSGTPGPHLRTTFNVGKKIVSARLYATALGLYEFYLNGRRVGEDIFTPGWIEYPKRVPYQAYDVTALIGLGANAAGALLGDGRYRGGHPRLLAQLVLTFAGGATQTVATDGTWKVSSGPIRENDLIHGETYDARREMPGWALPGFDDNTWDSAAVFPCPDIEISPPLMPPVRTIRELKPVAPPKKLPSGPFPVWIFDFGQKVMGRARLRVRGPAGQMAHLRFAEFLNRDGTLSCDHPGAARQTDRYILRGDPAGETWEPHFTFHGFRYVELSGPVADPLPDAITGVVLHRGTTEMGDFTCSDPLLNQLQRNIDWSLRDNFLEAPLDRSPHDERVGWMGDARIIGRTAAWPLDQGDHAWTDIAVIRPWTAYLSSGDTGLLERPFDSLQRCVASLEKKSAKLIHHSHPTLEDDGGKTDGGTPKDLIGTALFAASAHLLARIARVLGRAADATRHQRQFEHIRRAFQRRFITPDGLVGSLTQTGYVLALHFDLAPAALRPRLLAELVRDIELRGKKLSTGLVGTPYLPHVLTENGRSDLVYELLRQKEWPSWLFAVAQGPIGAWLYATVAGINLDPGRPAYKHIRFAPQPGGGLTSARGSLESPQGKIVSAWKLRPGRFTWEVVVPPNATATARFPVPPAAQITENGRPFARAKGATACELAAGRYRFVATWQPARASHSR